MAERKKRVVPAKFEGRKIYSISRLLSFHNCQHGYYLNYNLRKKGTPNIYSVLGTKVHDLLELMQFGQLSNEDALLQFRASLFENIDMKGFKFASEKIQQNFVNSIEHCLMTYKPIVCKALKSELEFFTEVNGVVLVGYIDAVALYEDGSIDIIDYKSSSKFTKANLDEHGLQLVLYAIALEQEWGAKITSVKWQMLKYCQVNWQGVSVAKKGFYLRTDLVKSLRNEFKRGLRKMGMSDIEIEVLLEQAQATNNMYLLPKEITDNFVVTEGFIEFELTDRTRTMLHDFIGDTVKEIEAKDHSDIKDWKAKEITKNDSFFCATLCDHKASCESYKAYVKSLEGITIDSMCTADSTSDEMLKQLFG